MTLTTPDFHARVLALEPHVAVFDCDGTLWSGDAGSAFMRWTMQTGLLSAERTAALKQRYELYNSGHVSELDICGEMVTCYAGLTEQALRAAAREFFAAHIEPNIFPELRALIAELQSRGTDIWCVSSTNNWVIEEGVARFSIPRDRVLAACLAFDDGVATDRLLDVPTDEGKVASLTRVGITAPDAVFGNSVHDAAMLSIARAAFPVNPSPALVDRATQEGWPVYWPASVSG